MRTKTICKLIISLWLVLPLIACGKGEADIDIPEPPVVIEPDPEQPVEVSPQQRSIKRGVSFNFRSTDDIKLLAPGISWAYNWDASQSSSYDRPFAESKIDFCPMAWNSVDAAALRAYKARNPQCNYLLAFNEPNLTDQANLTPRQAADRWPAIKSIAQELGLKVISPAMNYGTLSGYGDPIVWLDEFFKLVPLDQIDGIAIHCYMSYASALQSYVERFKKYGKPIWLTEFCAWEGSFTPEFQMKYMCDAINYLESEPMVARYAWFIPCGDNPVSAYPYMYLLDKSATVALTDLGKVFVNLSSQDKQTYHPVGKRIEAEHYAAISYPNAPTARPTTDSDGGLELFNFVPGQWVEYQVEVPETGEYTLTLRYSSSVESELVIEQNEGASCMVKLPVVNVGKIQWKEGAVKLTMEKGKRKFQIKLKSGCLCIGWLVL